MRSSLSPRTEELTCPRHPPYYPYGSNERSEPDNIRRSPRPSASLETYVPAPLPRPIYFALLPNKGNRMSYSSASTLPSQSHLRATVTLMFEDQQKKIREHKWQKFSSGKHDVHKDIEYSLPSSGLF